jgi:phospholipase C
MIRRSSRLGAVVALVVVGFALTPVGPRAAAAPRRTEATTTTPIKHLVVMTQDQHSFDNYFGLRPGVDGVPSGVCVPVRKASVSPCIKPFRLKGSGLHEPIVATKAVQATSIDGGRMDGFVHAQSSHTNAGRMAMGYYAPQDLPILNELADHAVLFDHWFTSVQGGSVQNRLFAVAAQSTSDKAEVPIGGWRAIPLIFDRLQDAGVSWRIYVENYEPALTIDTAGPRARRGGQVVRVPVLATRRFAESPQLSSHVVDLSRYYTDLAAGTLPAVTYIVSNTSAEHPPSDPRNGQVLARTVLNALSESRSWDSSAMLLSYDTAGGWYDHVPPPTINGTVLGPRVPALLVSPYTSPGSIDHTVYDSSSILSFIEHNWSVRPLTSRDRDAPDLSSAFSFQHPPRAPTLVGAHDQRPPLARPSSPIIYVAYLCVLIAVVVAVAGVLFSERRRGVVPVGQT